MRLGQPFSVLASLLPRSLSLGHLFLLLIRFLLVVPYSLLGASGAFLACTLIIFLARCARDLFFFVSAAWFFSCGALTWFFRVTIAILWLGSPLFVFIPPTFSCSDGFQGGGRPRFVYFQPPSLLLIRRLLSLYLLIYFVTELPFPLFMLCVLFLTLLISFHSLRLFGFVFCLHFLLSSVFLFLPDSLLTSGFRFVLVTVQFAGALPCFVSHSPRLVGLWYFTSYVLSLFTFLFPCLLPFVVLFV